jgi:hypothetical protein
MSEQKFFDHKGTEIKIGSRVKFIGNESSDFRDHDVGTVTRFDYMGDAWATWDSDGDSNCFMPGSTKFHVITEEKINQEIIVILHTKNGAVRTAYPVSMKAEAIEQFDSYIKQGKVASMTYGSLK